MKPFEKGYMQEVPRVEKFPIAIQFLATYDIVTGASNHSESIYKKSHLRVWMLKFW